MIEEFMTEKDFLEKVERGLESHLSVCEGRTGDAMRYAVLNGGKRVRPLCVYYGAKAVWFEELWLEERSRDLVLIAEAVELIHCYSLVHDDMPEMDNADFRRGKPSVHKEFGVATALLAGDGLLSLAMKVLYECRNNSAVGELVSVGALNMVFGQSAELDGCVTEKEYLDMYAGKTGALIKSAFLAGALCADFLVIDDCILCRGHLLKEKEVSAFAEHIGLAFQLADDLLDGDGLVLCIGRDKVAHMLEIESAKAVEAAKELNNTDELVEFANKLKSRRA